MNANSKRVPNDQAITKTLNLSGNYAFKLLRAEKWRRAERMANDLLSELPSTMRKSADALCLRMIGKAAKEIGDWLAADRAEHARRRTRKKRARRPQDNREREAKRLHVADLLLVPEAPAGGPAVAAPQLTAVKHER
jgi:DNA polymerase/3'-5' exonuclease PolX